jgi:hypothetical protein
VRTIRTMMLLTAVASLAVAITASTASASNWTKEGSPLASTALQWSDNGAPLEAEATTTFSGTFGFESESGAAECAASGAATLEEGGALGQVTKFDLSNCKGTWGVLSQPGCIISATANSLPWSQQAKTSGSTRVIHVQNTSISFKVANCKWAPSELVLSGTIVATPNNSKQISSLSMSGLMAITKWGEAEAIGSLGVSPAARYGIIGKEIVELSGSLGYSSEFGGVSCSVNALLLLEPGSKGEVISFDQASCGTSGSLSMQCGLTASLSATSLPWSVVNEGSFIRLTSVPMTITFPEYPGKCGPTLVSGELLATPNNVNAISSTKLAGTLLHGGIKQSWSGSVSWTPAGVYGL